MQRAARVAARRTGWGGGAREARRGVRWLGGAAEEGGSVYGDGKGASGGASAGEAVSLRSLHRRGQKIVMMTAYDAPGARAADAHADVLLVGDSVGMVVHGQSSTVGVSLADMVRHTQAVARSARRALVVSDLPFGSYLTVEDALRSSARLVQEGGAWGVKLEGGRAQAEKVRRLVAEGFQVMGHVGLLPQTASQMRVHGKSVGEAAAIVEDALALEAAGASSVVLEMVPDEVARAVTQSLRIPTIGIGAGPFTSGQVLVLHDAVGIFPRRPRFCRQYADVGRDMERAVRQFAHEVRSGAFPAPEHCFALQPKARAALDAWLRERQAAAESAPSVASAPPSVASAPEVRMGVAGMGALGQWIVARLAAPGGVAVATRRAEAAARVRADGGVWVQRSADGVQERVRAEAATEAAPSSVDVVFLAHGAGDADGLRVMQQGGPLRLREGGLAVAMGNGPLQGLRLASFLRSIGRTDLHVAVGTTAAGAALVRDPHTARHVLAETGPGAVRVGLAFSHDPAQADPLLGAAARALRATLIPHARDDAAAGATDAQATAPALLPVSTPELARVDALSVRLLPKPLRDAVLFKAAVNATLNPVAALLGLRNGDVALALSMQGPLPAAAPLCLGLAHEVARVLAALHVDLGALLDPDALPLDALLAPELLQRVHDAAHADVLRAALTVARKTADNTCSTLAMLRGGRATEVPHINGWVQAVARAHHIPTPRTDSLLQAFDAIHRVLRTDDEAPPRSD